MRVREAAVLCSELVKEFVERRGPVALAGKFAVETPSSAGLMEGGPGFDALGLGVELS
jgi:hypothetical protein